MLLTATYLNGTFAEQFGLSPKTTNSQSSQSQLFKEEKVEIARHKRGKVLQNGVKRKL